MTVYGCCNVSDDGFQERSTVNIIIKGFKKKKKKIKGFIPVFASYKLTEKRSKAVEAKKV